MAKTVGQILRQTRESKELSLEQVAEETNIRIHFLQAIEEDRMGAISSQTQMRGFTRLYASYLGLNPLELLEPVVPQPVQDLQVVTETVSTEQGQKEHVREMLSGLLPWKEQQDVHQPEKKQADEAQSEKMSDAIFKNLGADLQRQREALGLSRFDIERQIKIRELYIFALENGQIDELPSTVQGRGMLNNYAAFMNLDPEPLQMRFAEGLQQRRNEKLAEEEALRKNPPVKKFSAPITGWRRYLTPDILIGSGVFVVLFVLVIWGALQVIDTAHLQAKPTAENISSILISTPTVEVLTEEPTIEEATLDATDAPTSNGDVANTASVDLLATITAVGNNPIQIVVVAYQRAFLKVVVDGMEQFTGRVVPGQAYTFSGSSKITLTTGNAAALQVYYNQQDLGILGGNGQVINMDFSKVGMATATPQFTAIPTATQMPTFTQQPTYIPTTTPTEVVPTVTPYRP
jgi:cytoskeleton protein RodZ